MNAVTTDKRLTLRKAIKNVARRIGSVLLSRNLTALARIHRTDKWGIHRYTPHYQAHFHRLRWRKLKILEIGVGGYDSPTSGGQSLRMWKYYFPRSQIFSLDIYDKSPLEENRIRIFRGSQNDPEFLKTVIGEIGAPDIIIDDGSHVNEHMLTSFNTLFPLLAENGIYAIEDLQTSYWPEYGGDSYNLSNPGSIMSFLKDRVDGLNYEEIARKGYVPSYFDQHVVSMHFYHNLVFIYKGANREGSAYVQPHVY